MSRRVGRLRFLGTSAAAIGAALLPRVAGATVTLGPHKHGLNGLKLPLDQTIGLTSEVLDGPKWSLQANRGSVVFMNFFATWCAPCVHETSSFVAYAARAPENVAVVAMNVGDEDDLVRTWRKRFAVPYPICMDRRRIFAANINLSAYPTTLIFRPDGRLSCAFVGSMDDDDLETERLYAIDPART